MRKKKSSFSGIESHDHSKVTFEFSHCAIFGGGPLIEWDGKKSELRWKDCYGDAWNSLPTPSDLQWKAFWLLLEQSGARNWDTDYSNPNILDGIGWDFKLNAPGLRIASTGSNAYPGSDSFEPLPGFPFDILTTAIGILVGCDPDDLKAPPHPQINLGVPPDVEVDSGDGEEGPLL
jgi:hypothetical protein